MRLLLSSLLFAALPSVSSGGDGTPNNFLIIVADDLGVDHVAAYGEHPVPGLTPNIDALAGEGVLFRNAWVTPSCSPTRASILTGRYPSRHGIGTALGSMDPHGLALAELTLPELLTLGTGGHYTSLAAGKWHLAGTNDPLNHPLKQGFSRHAGSLGNIADYENWTKLIDGVPSVSTTYATTDTTDEALAMVAATAEPWFTWVAYNAPHSPLHVPPAHLSSSFTLSGPPQHTPVLHMRAMVQALDTEVGRLLNSIDPAVLDRTVVIFLGDNGTWGPCVETPFNPGRAKGTPYEGGVNVPFIVAGAGVENGGRETEELVSGVDLFSTVALLAGVDPATHLGGVRIDSVPFVDVLLDQPFPGARKWVYSEGFLPLPPASAVRESWTIREGRYKFILQRAFPAAGGMTEEIELFDLVADPFELQNLWSGAAGVLPFGCPRLNRIGVRLRSTF